MADRRAAADEAPGATGRAGDRPGDPGGVMDAAHYYSTGPERARTADLMRLLPEGRETILEIGARFGYFSRLLSERFRQVTALDLERPQFEIPGVVPVRGDVTRLDFPDDSFDCVICTEVLEHVPDLDRAAAEIGRVVRHEAIIGVPYRQDTRIGRTTCAACGRVSPPWGHVNTFDEPRLKALFSRLEPVETSLVGENREWTNALSAWLMDQAGNPWGTYDQGEPCIHCGAPLVAPPPGSIVRRSLASAALRLRQFQSRRSAPRANWIHMVFRKR